MSRRNARPAYPHAVEAAYTRRLEARATALHRTMVRELAAAGVRVDAETAPAWGSLFRIVVAVRQAWGRLRPAQQEEQALQKASRQLDLFADRRLASQLPTDMAPRVSSYQAPGDRDRLEGWVRDNVGLITSIDSRYFADIEKLVTRAQEGGWGPDQLTRALQQRYDVSRARARLIARDQVGKLNGQLTEAKQRRLGVTHYVWRTAGDSRVRESHAPLDGQVFAWDDVPAPGHPGQDYQCRCGARPVLPHEDLEEVRVRAAKKAEARAARARRRAARA